MAVFHAKAARILKQPPSKHYTHACQYFAGELGWDQWPFIGYQGIADLAARLDENGNAKLLAKAIPQLPPRPLEALCHCLENEEIPLEITQALLDRAQETLCDETPDPAILTCCTRGIALTCSTGLRRQLLQEILERPEAASPDILAAISGRTWELLKDEKIGLLFLERLSESGGGQAFFNQCLTDLLYIPGMREPLLKLMRNPACSEELSKAIGELLDSIGAASHAE